MVCTHLSLSLFCACGWLVVVVVLCLCRTARRCPNQDVSDSATNAMSTLVPGDRDPVFPSQ
ncbi:uncharacterized protein THITE_2108836 [Thermothielavioides terrestris NRRL 8126]|uniref:Uncharacterized protein n=1 Tax=Thermothielavioides terrestris (strain ATCC 38088 / NRRL 8126) TaxID=578455 RepID=G2QSK6_THETT|nr:uncharacterized protein THITE_2108836 [Thermothielavioides terrestris NRRL 8126]AEO63488.1 hypothetical protein THITE_2108836 [Thermothielavioides terrestris NRRL 8126]